MNTFLKTATFALAAAAAVSFSTLAAGATPQQTVSSLTGTWNCVTHDSMHKTWKETDVNAMFGSWLKSDTTYPAQNGQKAATATNFFGYDAKNKRFITMGVDTGGGYGTSYSTSATFDGAHWSNGYPVRPGTSITHMSNPNEYTVDYSGPGNSGKHITSHAVCTRS